jgi:putative oxidoreductase
LIALGDYPVTPAQQNSLPQTQPSFLEKLLQSNLPSDRGFQAAWSVSRVVVGLLMIHNGTSKLADVEGFASNVVTFIGFPYPIFLTYCAAYTEIIGSIFLIVGAFTRLSASALFFTMLIAIYFHLKKTGLQLPPVETASLYAVSFLSFVVNGGGKFSIDQLLLQWRKS